ncbi:MAG: S46 family peptidase, partial [Dinghuibacter sp.]|nr:S46 family peptidase [Dinghuibacter sp.]
PFYNGNQYFMFITLTYKDIRLAGAPPSSIGAFGSDTDNWVWPRHGGDFSVFRIYSNRNNRPADYSSSNIPFTPKKHLPISLDGVTEGDFTMVFGFPGRTNEYLPSNAVNLTANVLNPARIAMRDATLKIQKEFMQQDEQVKIQYASKYSGIANQWKKMIGETQGINFSHAIDKKLAYEKDFTARVNANPKLKSEYGGLLEKLNRLHKDIEPYALVRDYFNELISNVEVLDQAMDFVALERAYVSNGEAGWNKEKAGITERLPAFFKDYQPKIDQKVLATLMNIYMKNVGEEFIGQQASSLWDAHGKNGTQLAAEVFAKSALVSESKTRQLLNLPVSEAIKKIKEDIAYQLLSGLGSGYNSGATPVLNQLQPEINALQRTYMQAQLQAFPQKRFYPDANGTLRVTYGKVKGFRPRDGVEYGYYTYLDGVMEKYIPGDYEFDVPAKLIDLYKKKDYGQYGANGRMPVAFIGANHTTGGNSGSPAIDAYGNLVGINFDRVWEGTMSDL